MSEPGRIAALQAANERRRQEARAAAEEAIRSLQRAGSSVTFTSVANEAGVARSWLYQQPELRRVIGRLRDAPPPPAVDAGRASNESLRRMAEGLRLELNRLRQENQTLRDQMARQLGLDRSQHHRRSDGEDMSSPSYPRLTRTSSRTS